LQYHPERPGAGGHVERSGRIEGEANSAGCERHPRFKCDFAAIIETGPQTPSNAADPDRSPQIQDCLVKPVLEIVEMIGVYSESIDELSVTIFSH
jgi:hypothetical protein